MRWNKSQDGDNFVLLIYEYQIIIESINKQTL